jgi:hypothetical protein
LNLIIEVDHNHGRLVVVVRDEFSHDNTCLCVVLLYQKLRLFRAFLQPERLAQRKNTSASE